jgi:hypothetical protein
MIDHKVLRAGQAKAYHDSVYDYEITSDEPEAKVREHCITILRKVRPEYEVKGYSHTGTCGFPFGLSSFYTFAKTGENRYRYTVTSPYCD